MRARLAYLRLLLILVGWLGGLSFPGAAELVVEVVPLRYRTLEQILPVLQPLVPPPGTASGVGSSLVLRTSPQNVSEIKRVLATLDRAPRRLRITVRQDADREGTARIVSDATIASDPRAVTGVIARTDGASAPEIAGRVYGTQSTRNDRNTQQVHVLEGSDATISVGYSVPIVSRSGAYDGRGRRVIDRSVEVVEYRDITSGFTVRPQLAGDRVSVQISPQHDTPLAIGRGGMNVQRVGTTVSGRLGEWIEIGAVIRGRTYEADSATFRTAVASGDNRRILMMIEALDAPAEESGAPLGRSGQLR